MEKQAWMTAHLFTKQLTEYFKPLLRNSAAQKKKKKISFNILLLIDNAPAYPQAQTEMYKIDVVFKPADTTCIL